MVKRILFILHCSLFIVHGSFAQSDTTKVHDLQEVEVQTTPENSAYLSSSSQQKLNAAQLQQLNALQVSDAVKHFSGVQVKDYGGVGGLKTVSLRSLGANHTNVIYDGLAVSDYQTGQADLGRFSLDNVEMITLNIGASDNIFQTAQAQSLAGTLNIITQSPETNADKNIQAGIKTGSFNLLNPALLYRQKINPIFSADVSGDYLKTDGDYPFVQDIGYSGNEKEHKKRENSDVETLKLEANLKGNFKNGGNLLFKNYFYTSERGLPGAAIYHKDEPYYDRLKDHNFFSQIHYQQPLRENFQFQTNAKFSMSHTNYFNPNMPTIPVNKQTSLYDQREFYLNATFLYQLTGKIAVSWANDGTYCDMEGNQMLVSPSRTSWLSALSGKYEIKQFNVTAKLLNTTIHDKTVNQAIDYNHLSPYLGLSVQPVSTVPLRIRGFYKNTFRMPTFGDLYYSPSPISLKPEKAQQYDLGVTVVTDFGQILPYFSVNADVYWNKIRDKIVAAPTRSLFWWSMLNYGKVAINGVDLNVNMEIPVGALRATPLRINIFGTYTCQNALNKSKEKPETYNKRLIYTARHSASGNILLKTPWVDAGYNMIYCGKRYNREDNEPTSQMHPFTEQGINLMRTFIWQKTKITLSAECLNIGNAQYEVVNSYPMPARSFRFGIKMIY